MLTARIEEVQRTRFYACESVQYHHHGFLDHRGECIVVLDGPNALAEIVENGTVYVMNAAGQTVGRFKVPTM